MCTEMQFTGIFLLFGTFMCLPTLYASVLPSGEEMDFIHANAQTQARAFSSIRQLKDISDVVNEGKKFLHNTQSKDALKSKVPFKCALALTHSNLTKEIFKQMDRNLQVNNLLHIH
ncbi:uncharacterized protein LOC106883827 [Octopus bimaculoides]|uniref:Uncharacterized protein n=1 Tax=Octopus bimaculoides TaxID=37653 RepID=A0A0L8I6F2_OCTBM|nr:uncharacterized protein LOC106883827 [Octopus bimaculoides]|eukprot:XP_014790453.1 PREDICTED: uncharacterized protein LOC106883827 [Octopus bimaculoides]